MLGLTLSSKLNQEERTSHYYQGVTILQAMTIRKLHEEVSTLRGQKVKTANLMAKMQDELDKRQAKMEELAQKVVDLKMEVKTLKKNNA